MNITDIRNIEQQLEIKLPEFYISTMLNYPFQKDSWGAVFALCNDPQQVIDLNCIFIKEDECFVIGFDGGEFSYFIKLNGEEKVYIFDLEGSEAHMSIEAESWKDYLAQLDLTHEEHLQIELQKLERKKNKKWWQFWI